MYVVLRLSTTIDFNTKSQKSQVQEVVFYEKDIIKKIYSLLEMLSNV